MSNLFEENYADALKRWNSTPRYEAEMNAVMGFMRNIGIIKGKILDVGCGNGTFVNFLRDKGYDARGCDIESFSKSRYIKKTGTKVELPYRSNSFDAVIMMHSLAHMNYPSAMIRECNRVLKSDGYLIIATPNSNFLRYYKIINFIKRYQSDPTVAKHYNENEIEDLILENDFYKYEVIYYGKKPFGKDDYNMHPLGNRERIFFCARKL